MKRLFLDTGYVIALEASDDQHHEAAVAHWRDLLEAQPRLLTTSWVFDEVVTFFNSRGHHQKATEIGHRLLASPSIELVHVGSELFESAWDYFCARPDKRFSLTDCASFVLMRRESLSEALAFDRHFAQAGFTALPPR